MAKKGNSSPQGVLPVFHKRNLVKCHKFLHINEIIQVYHFHSHVRLASNKNFEDRIVLSTILTVIWYLYYKTIWNATKNIYQIFKKYINNIFFFKKKVIKFMTDLILKHVFNFFLIILILKFKFNRSKKKINTKH